MEMREDERAAAELRRASADAIKKGGGERGEGRPSRAARYGSRQQMNARERPGSGDNAAEKRRDNSRSPSRDSLPPIASHKASASGQSPAPPASISQARLVSNVSRWAEKACKVAAEGEERGPGDEARGGLCSDGINTDGCGGDATGEGEDRGEEGEEWRTAAARQREASAWRRRNERPAREARMREREGEEGAAAVSTAA